MKTKKPRKRRRLRATMETHRNGDGFANDLVSGRRRTRYSTHTQLDNALTVARAEAERRGIEHVVGEDLA